MHMNVDFELAIGLQYFIIGMRIFSLPVHVDVLALQ